MTPQELEAVLPTGDHDATLLRYGGKSVPLHLLLPALLDLWRAAEKKRDPSCTDSDWIDAEIQEDAALDRLREVQP